MTNKLEIQGTLHLVFKVLQKLCSSSKSPTTLALLKTCHNSEQISNTLKGFPGWKFTFNYKQLKKNIKINGLDQKTKQMPCFFVYSENMAPGSFQSVSGAQMKVCRGSIESK